MNILLENVNLNSNTGPNYFGQKLIKYLSLRNVSFNNMLPYDIKLSFIESFSNTPNIPLFQRLDSIYYNQAKFNCEKMNYNIKKTYEKAKGIIFQSNFNKELIFEWFGPHDNYTIINNGADVLGIDLIAPYYYDFTKNFNKSWVCAASWRPLKRLRQNIEYFLEFSQKDECLIVVGEHPDVTIEDSRVFFVGHLDVKKLLAVCKASDYFIHLGYLDGCPNVVIDARASGCKIVCSSSGGTKEIAGPDAIVVQEEDWDYSPLHQIEPPILELGNVVNNDYNSDISMVKCAKKYHNFFLNK